MPTKRHYKLRGRNDERTRDGIDVLVRGIDVFRDFTGDGDELAELWGTYGEEITARYTALDGSLRPAGWWWFSSPQKIRIAWPGHPPSATEQRELLVAWKVLDAASVALAKEKIAAYEASGELMAVFDCRHPLPDPQIEL